MKDVVGFEGKYKITMDGKVYSSMSNKFLSPYLTKGRNGEAKYLRVGLKLNGKNVNKFVHRLVAEAYVQNSDSLPFVNHINGIKTDNHYENLEWCTARENDSHARLNGLTPSLIGNKQKRNTSGYVGVTKSGNKWKAQIRIDKKLL